MIFGREANGGDLDFFFHRGIRALAVSLHFSLPSLLLPAWGRGGWLLLGGETISRPAKKEERREGVKRCRRVGDIFRNRLTKTKNNNAKLHLSDTNTYQYDQFENIGTK